MKSRADQINGNKQDLTLLEKFSHNATLMPQILSDFNFSTIFSGFSWLLDEKTIGKNSSVNVKMFSPGSSFYDKAQGLDFGFLMQVGAIRYLPWSFKKKIYNQGEWRGRKMSRSFANYKALEAFTTNSNTLATTNTLKFIANDLPHPAWRINGETLEPDAEDPYPETKGEITLVDGIIPEHYYAEKATLKLVTRWLKWMKENGVYDNTQIILVSDHEARAESRKLRKLFGATSPTNLDEKYPGGPHALLAVKNRNERFALKKSKEHMSTSDVLALVFYDLRKTFSLKGENMFKAYNLNKENRTRYHFITHRWNPKQHKENAYIIDGAYEI